MIISDTGTEPVGRVLQRLRTARGLSLGGLALRSGVHKATLSRWESGKQQPGIPELEATLVALEATPPQRTECLRLLSLMGAPRAARQLREEFRKEVTQAGMALGSSQAEGELLRTLRLRRGWSQEQLAGALTLHLSTISRWERSEALPEPERLDALCALLEASKEEKQALTRRELSRPREFEAIEHEFRTELSPLLLEGELFIQLDLSFLSLEAALWMQAHRRPSACLLLGEVYAHHAAYLRNRERFTEAIVCGKKALELVQASTSGSSLRQTQEWLELATVCIADGIGRGGRRPAHAAEFLRSYMGQQEVSPKNKSWFYRRVADFLLRQGKHTEAIMLLQLALSHAEQLAVHFPWGKDELAVNRRAMMQSQLHIGQIEAAATWFTQEWHPHPGHRFNDALAYMRICLHRGQHSEAHDSLGRAFAELAAYPGLAHRRPEAERLALLL